MQYQVISRFFDRERGVYVDVGSPCPRLSRRTAERLLRARCIAPVEQATPPKGGRGKTPVVPPPAVPDAPPAPPPAGE